MTILNLDRKELESKVGKISEKVEEKITMMGTPVEEISDKEISIEVFPNRPDLLSLQGFARSLNQYLGKEGVAGFKINKPGRDYLVKVEKSVKSVRPFTACAVVKGLSLDDEKIKELVDIQEKLHLTIGRKRKKIAIGIYPLEKIKLPIKFVGMKPDEIKFIPLESPGNKEMTGRQILRSHPTGREYAHFLQDKDIFPVFLDADNNVLSMPPIINSHKTGKITENTKEVFIECSGFNLEYLKKTLNIVVSALYDMGGKVYAMDIDDYEKGKFVSPDLESEKMEFKIENINKTLGLDLSEKEIRSYLEQMGIDSEKSAGKMYALIPAYRIDILHWIDLAEEAAIAYGYDKFEPEIPDISTVGEEDKSARIKKTIGEVLAGLGLFEVSSFHLAKKIDIKKMHFDFKEWIETEDSKTEYSVLRIDLLSNLMKIFSENSDSQYPQKIFELGRVFEIDKENKEEAGIKETEKLAIALADEKFNFTDLKSVLDYLFKMIGKEYKIEETENNNFISGRVGKVIVDGKGVGVIGEIAPRVLKNWKIKVPVVAVELEIGFILE